MGIEEAILFALAAMTVAALGLVYHLFVQSGGLLLRIERMEDALRAQGLLPPGDAPSFEALPAGSMLNDFCLPLLSGGTMTLFEWRGQRVLLIFFNPGCSFSRRLLQQMAEMGLPSGDSPRPLFVTSGDAEENRRLFEAAGFAGPVLLQEASEVSSLYRVRGTPIGMLVDEKGATVGEALVGADSLLDALGRGHRASAPSAKVSPVPNSQLLRDGLKAGTPAPDFELPRVHGGSLSLRDYRGRNVLLVFCNPTARLVRDWLPLLKRFIGRARTS